MSPAPEPVLTPRQGEILVRVVEEYVATGAPVGSKTLVERAAMDVSASTVRYELAVLEERGLLSHPHTSAGRVPTDLGYRFFVDRVIDELQPQPSELALDVDFSELRNEVEEALRATTDALAEMTHLLALVSAPPLEATMVRRVEVLLLQPQLVMVVVITATGGVTKRLFTFDRPVDPGLAEWAGQYLNETLGGRQLGGRMLRAYLEDLQLGERERAFLSQLRPAFADVLELPEQAFYVGGTAGVFGEFRPDELAGYQRLLEVLEQRAMALELMRASLVSKRPFVRVGPELADPQLARVSLVGAPYGLQHRNLGTVSLVGPMRMDYVKAIDAVRTAARELSRFVEDLYES
jgi:heat-inducible transcriptional repressor